jgi:hypothetical protein
VCLLASRHKDVCDGGMAPRIYNCRIIGKCKMSFMLQPLYRWRNNGFILWTGEEVRNVTCPDGVTNRRGEKRDVSRWGDEQTGWDA